MYSVTHLYDVFSQMTLAELIEQEKSALAFLDSTSAYMVQQAKRDLRLIREVMKAVHDYNWITKQIRTVL
jgi:hypothetical protein